MARDGEVLAGRYELTDRVSRGGMAEVYRARDRALDRVVAVKILDPSLVGDRSFVARFQREARAAASLSHPNVVAIHDTGSDGDRHFIVMELVDGPDLSEVIASEGPMDDDRAIAIARQVCEALGAAHAQGLVHRDVKPGNILFTASGTAKVSDFGIARAMATATRTDTVYGSAPYIAPEQARGEDVDPRADVYALGCVLYEMLTGRPPFTADSPLAVVYQHLNKDPSPPGSIVGGVDPGLDAVVLRALAKDPDDRYEDIATLSEDLRRVAAGDDPIAGVSAATQVITGATETVPIGDVVEPPWDRDEDDDRIMYVPAGRSRTTPQAALLALALLAIVALAVLVLTRTVDLGSLVPDAPVTEPTVEPATEPTTDPTTDPEPEPEPEPSTPAPSTPAPSTPPTAPTSEAPSTSPTSAPPTESAAPPSPAG